MRIPRLRLRLVTAIIITISDLRRQKQLAKDGKGGSSLVETIYHDWSLGNSIGDPQLLKLANYSPYAPLAVENDPGQLFVLGRPAMFAQTVEMPIWNSFHIWHPIDNLLLLYSEENSKISLLQTKTSPDNPLNNNFREHSLTKTSLVSLILIIEL